MSNIISLPTNQSSNIKFTKSQQIAIDGLIDFIAEDFNPVKHVIGLNGAGGTGKTFIMRFILNNCIYSPSMISCATPTHKACRVLSAALGGKQVNTIQSTFGFRLDVNIEDFDPNNLKFRPVANPKLEGIRLLIIDESSMLPSGLVTHICKICKENSIKVIFVGDNSQLPPTNELKSIAFARCFKTFTLTEIVRQEEINPISRLLDLIRKDIENKTNYFLQYVIKHKGTLAYNEKQEGFSIVGANDFKDNIMRCFFTEEFTKNIDMYKIIGYTNLCISKWNNFVRNNIIKNCEKGILTKHDLIMSYETVVDEFLDPIIYNSEEYIVNDIVNFIDSKYNFKGYLVKFQLVHGGYITKPLFIIDHTDIYTIKMYYKTISDLIDIAKNSSGGRRAENWKKYFNFKSNYLLMTNIVDKYDREKIIFARDIDYGFAITSHKSQGSTYDNVFVDLNDIIYDKNGKPYSDYNQLMRCIYVACSRARKQLILSYGI